MERPDVPLLERRESGFLVRDMTRPSPRDIIQGYTITPTVAAISAALVVSYAALLSQPSAYVFATVTNLCYLFAGFIRELITLTNLERSTPIFLGHATGGALILALLGASSFAYHSKSTIGSPAHTLDILFGWLLVMHLFYTTMSVVVLALVSWCLPDALDSAGLAYGRAGLSIAFLASAVVVMTAYDTVYANQRTFYLVLGPCAAVFGAILRAFVAHDGKGFTWKAIGLAVAELTVALTLVVSAILCQGELLGRTLDKATMPKEYDFWHGNWHFMLAMVSSLLYTRASDAAHLVQFKRPVCVCTLPALDWVAEGLLFIYASLAMIFKETGTDLTAAIITLGVLALCFELHAVIAMVAWSAGEETYRVVPAR